MHAKANYEPLVSIVMAVQNEELYLEKCLDSILGQTWGNWELIAVNDHSVDKTWEILEEYADSRLDFVDATIVALAERLNITRVLTLDRRDFSIIRPAHCSYFEILP